MACELWGDELHRPPWWPYEVSKLPEKIFPDYLVKEQLTSIRFCQNFVLRNCQSKLLYVKSLQEQVTRFTELLNKYITILLNL